MARHPQPVRLLRMPAASAQDARNVAGGAWEEGVKDWCDKAVRVTENMHARDLSVL
jgi:hypothetical protein